jgi:hypothetical protein
LKNLRKNDEQSFDDPFFQSPSSEQIAEDRLVRKAQLTDGVVQLGRLFSQLSLLLCSTDCNDDKLADFRCGLKKIIKTDSMTFHLTKPGIGFTSVMMMSILIHIARFMKVGLLFIYFIKKKREKLFFSLFQRVFILPIKLFCKILTRERRVFYFFIDKQMRLGNKIAINIYPFLIASDSLFIHWFPYP